MSRHVVFRATVGGVLLLGVVLPIHDARLAPAPSCPFGLSRSAVRACGTLTVFPGETHAATLAYAVLPGRSGPRSAAATVVIPGGPGGSAGRLPRRLSALLEDQKMQPKDDIIFYDPRGVGESQPGGRTPCQVRLLTAELAPETFGAQVKDCLKLMAQHGTAPQVLITRNNAEDLVTLARTLGYQQVNLYGMSYGTRTAQEVVRRHPGFVRSLVLDGVVDPTVNPFTRQARHFQQTLQAFGRACKAAGRCHEGDLARRVQRSADLLEARNLKFSGQDLGVQRPLPLNGSVLLSALWDTGYSPQAMQGIEPLLDRLDRRQAGSVDALVESARQEGGDTVDPGVYAAVNCRDTRPQKSAPEGLLPVFEQRTQATRAMFNLCSALGLNAPPDAQDAVHANVPALLLSGRYDAVTPPETADAVAQRFSPSKHVIFESGGHINGKSECGAQLLFRFLEDLSLNLDTACAARPYAFQ